MIKSKINNLFNEINSFKEGYFFLFIAFIAIIYISFTDFLVNYPHQEVYEFFTTTSFQGKPYLNPDTFKIIFSPMLEGNTDRIRFYNWIVWVFDSLFRFNLFKVIPFHPSISLNWVFTLFVLPYFLFKYLFDLSKDKVLSLQCTAMFYFTQGYLSLQTLYFHSAKPMSILGIVACMYFTQKIKQNTNPLQERNLFVKLSITILFSMFWDEFFYTYFLIAPLIYPDIVKNRKVFYKFSLLYGAFFIVFYLVSTIIYPAIIKSLYNYDFSFWRYAFSSNEGITSLKLENFLYNFRSLISVHIIPFKPIVDYNWQPSTPYNDYYISLFFILLLIPVFQRRFFAKHVLVSIVFLLIFWVFQSLIVTRRDGILEYGSYYWGSPFSLFFVITICSFWANYKSKFMKYIRVVFLLAFCIIGYRHNETAALGYLNTFIGGQSFPNANLPMKKEVRRITYDQIYLVWKNSSDMKKVQEIMKDYPINAYWLYFEALLQNLKGNVKDDFQWYDYSRLKESNIIN